MGRDTNAQNTTAPSPRAWDAVVGRAEACLKPNARRYRVTARNAARAALQALHRHGVSLADATEAHMHVALYDPDATQAPNAVFAVAGESHSPCLQLLYGRLLPQAATPFLPGGPLDSTTVDAELPQVARRRVEARFGSSGIREVLTEQFWVREVSLYTGTAMVLAAIGFPMSPGVFVVGGVLLLIQGSIRLVRREIGLRRRTRKVLRGAGDIDELREAAARTIFVRGHKLIHRDRTKPAMVTGTCIVPDLRRTTPLTLLVDEDARIAAGGLTPMASASDSQPAELTDLESLAPSNNVLTVVFRRPKTRIDAPETSETKAEAPAAESDDKPDLDEIGKAAKVPAKVDADELGNARRERQPAGGEGEDVEVIDAEVLDPDETVPAEPAGTGAGRGRDS